MIDIEPQIFTAIADHLRELIPKVNIQGVLTLTPSEFPCVCIEEADNSAYEFSRDSKSNENHAEIMYEVNVYSNKAVGAKSECKALLAAVDELMDQFGFTRMGRTSVRGETPVTYRMVSRYRAVVGKDFTIYRR